MHLQTLLPSVCSREDAHQLLQDIVRQKPTAVVFCDSIVTCDEFVESCAAVFSAPINVQAEKVHQCVFYSENCCISLFDFVAF